MCAPRQLDLLIQKSFPDLQFLLDEFVKLESVVTPQGSRGESPACDEDYRKIVYAQDAIVDTSTRVTLA